MVLETFSNTTNILYVLEHKLGDRPDDSDSKEEDDEFSKHHDIFIEVEVVMSVCLAPELKVVSTHGAICRD